jgi:hypothetical protein
LEICSLAVHVYTPSIVVLPTAIVENRRCMVKLYSWQMMLGVNCHLRYDAWNSSEIGRQNMAFISISDVGGNSLAL